MTKKSIALFEVVNLIFWINKEGRTDGHVCKQKDQGFEKCYIFLKTLGNHKSNKIFRYPVL